MEILNSIPDGITPVKLDAIVMPNGEVISCGKILGRVKDFEGMLEIKEEAGFYSVLRLHRDDIRMQGFDPETLTENDMEKFARKIGEACMDSFWYSLDDLCEDLPKLEEDLMT